MRRLVKKGDGIGGGSQKLPLKPALRAIVLIPDDSPLHQIEIEVVAALLDDWDLAPEEQPQ